jgi:hypothetical protein
MPSPSPAGFTDDSAADLAERVARLTAMVFVLSSRLAELEERVGVSAPALDGDWICPKDAAFRTGFSRSTVHQWTRRGRVVSRKIGGRVLISARPLPGAR